MGTKQILGGKLLDYQHTTLLRGVAILMIVLGHVSGTFHTVVLNPIASTGVAIFMILSGYGLTLSYKKNGLKSFWSKKILRVLLPYSFVIVTILIVNENYDWRKWILELTGLQTTYWYVDYQIKWYIVFYIVMLFAVRYNILLFSVISVVMFFVLPTLAAEQSFAFVIGVIIAKYRERLSSISLKAITVWGILAFVAGTLFLAFKQFPDVRLYTGSKFYSGIQLGINLSYAISILAFSCLLPSLRNSVLLVLAGGISYEIYLLHFPFYGYVQGKFVYACILIVVSIMISKLYSIFIGFVTPRLQWLISAMCLAARDNRR